MTPFAKAAILGLLTSTTAAIIWAVLAWRTPTSTFHFAPLVASIAGPYVAHTVAGRQPVGRAGSVVAASGLAVAAAGVILAVGDRLRGPTFWSEEGAWLEVVIFTAVGLAAGFGLLSRRPRRPQTGHESRHQAEQQTM